MNAVDVTQLPEQSAVILPAETVALLQAGKLSQRCPACGTGEAAGCSCTRCGRAMGPATWPSRQERGRPASVPHEAPRLDRPSGTRHGRGAA